MNKKAENSELNGEIFSTGENRPIYVSRRKKLCKGTKKVQNTKKKSPGVIWDANSIRTAIDQFILENGRLPKGKELRSSANMPTVKRLEQVFQMPFVKWIYENYPLTNCNYCRGVYTGWNQQDYERIFIKEYNRIHPTAAPTYDANRTNGTPGWQCISRMLGTTTWLGLKAKLEDKLDVVQYERYSHPKNPNTQTFQVYSEIIDYGL